MRNANKILVGKPEGKRPLGRPRLRWEGNIKMDLREIGLEGVDRIHLAQDTNLLWAFVNILVENLTESTVSFSRRTLLHGVSQLVTHALCLTNFIINQEGSGKLDVCGSSFLSSLHYKQYNYKEGHI
jgi:hypothetical protein